MTYRPDIQPASEPGRLVTERSVWSHASGRMRRLPGLVTCLCLGLLAGGILTGCGQDNTPFVSHEFDLEDRHFSIQLPPKAYIQSSADKSLVMINLQAGAPKSPRITLRKPFTGDAVVRGGKSVKLANSAILDYKVSATDTGSDAPEAFLNGHITMQGSNYVVSCNIQSQYVTIAQAAWCVDYLGSISPR